MKGVPAMQPHERYIAIGGESWAAALGQDRAKYITPKVGIFLYGPDTRDIREQVEGMAYMSGNVDMALFPLLQIMEVMQEKFLEYGKLNEQYKEVSFEFQAAIGAVRRADKTAKQRP